MMRRTLLTSALDMPEIMSYIYSKSWKLQFSASSSIIIIEDYYLQTFLHSLDIEFRRYMYRGKENVTAQSVILAIAHKINKLHNKIQSEKTGQHLFRLKETA